MNDDVDNPTNESEDSQAPEEPSGPRGGERLAEARRELQISVLEISKELHLDEAKVRALERNEFDVLGAPVFAKGHLRKYSQLVNVKEEDVFADYYEMTRAAGLPPVVSKRRKPRQELSPGPWIAVIVVLIIAATAYWWFSRPSEPSVAEEPTIEAPPATDVEESVDEPIEEPEIEPEPEDGPEPQAQEDTAVETAAPVIEETVSPEIAAGQVRLALSYTGDCWTEITDATGRRLFFALGRDGRSVELSGAEPLNVLFGNPGNVTVTVNGDDYALPESARPNRPLRLSINGL